MMMIRRFASNSARTMRRMNQTRISMLNQQSNIINSRVSNTTIIQQKCSDNFSDHQQTGYRLFSSTGGKNEYICVHVFVTCKPGTSEAFQAASLLNARASAQESGIARFDVIQQTDDPNKFVLVEVYKDEDAPSRHKETEHYMLWRETVADMMAEPRSAIKYRNLFPSNGKGWDYGSDVDLE